MSRDQGTFNFSANFEPLVKAPLDARMVVDTLADLTSSAQWNQGDGNVWLYNGMPVVVRNDTSDNNGMYYLSGSSGDAYLTSSNWIRVGGGTATTASFAYSASNAVYSFYAEQSAIAADALNAVTASYIHADNVDGLPTQASSTASLVLNDSSVSGSSVKDALETLSSSIETVSSSVANEITDLQNFSSSVLTSNLDASFGVISGSTAKFSGNVDINGILNVNELQITELTRSIIYTSGSTRFGDTLDDIHEFTGSVKVNGSITSSVGLVTTNIYIPGVSAPQIEVGNLFRDGNNQPVLYVSNQTLQDSGGDTTLDWSNRHLIGTWELDQVLQGTSSYAVTASYVQSQRIFTEYYYVTASTEQFDLTYIPTSFNQVKLSPQGAGEMINSQSLVNTGGDTSAMSTTPDFRLSGTQTIEISGSGLSNILYGSNELLIISYEHTI